jgi:protein SYS1
MLAVIVEKSKKCLDFSATLFLLHLFISTFYGGFPVRLDWWVVHIAATILMILLGEYLCSRRELDDIPLLTL